MRRKVTLATWVLLLGAVLPAQGAQPFGQFGGKVGGGNAGSGLLPLHGWALDDDGVAAVDLLVDGFVAGRANYGRGRPAVTAAHPGFPDSAAPGWAFQLDTTRYLNGKHTVTPRVLSRSGEQRDLNSLVFTFTNASHQLVPFGAVEFPKPHAELYGKCNLTDPNRRYSVVSGYALDLGLQRGDSGVGYVELMVDRAIRADTQTDCRFSAVEGGLSDCYGLRRVDLERLFPHIKDAPHSGFRFVLDVGALMTGLGYTPGSHVLTVRAGDHGEQISTIQEIPVTFICAEDVSNEDSFGDINLPPAPHLFHGVVAFTGWALDWDGIRVVEYLVDGESLGPAAIGLPRPEIASNYPGYPQNATAGWRALVDTRKLSNGTHELEVIVYDTVWRSTYIGKRSFVVVNP